MKPHIRLARVDGRPMFGVWICYVPQPDNRFYPRLDAWMGVGVSPHSAYAFWKSKQS